MECNEPKDFSRSYTFGVTYDRYHKNLVHIPTHPTHTLTPHPHPLHTHKTRLQICKYFKSILSVTITFFSHTHQHYTHTLTHNTSSFLPHSFGYFHPTDNPHSTNTPPTHQNAHTKHTPLSLPQFTHLGANQKCLGKNLFPHKLF